MANEPERPIETLLRAAAKKRRDEAGAPFELHPADRRLLQGDVARRYAKSPAEPRSLASLLSQLWPRFAWGVGILAILGLSVWLLLPLPRHAESEALLARNRPLSEDLSAKELPPAPMAAPAMIAPQPAPADEVKPAEVAYAKTASPSRPTPASQLGVAAPVIAKDTAVAQDERQTLELNAPAQLAEQHKKVEMQLAAPSGTPPPTPAGAVGGAYGARYGLAAKPSQSAVAPAPTTAPVTVSATPQPATVALATDSARAAEERSNKATSNAISKF